MADLDRSAKATATIKQQQQQNSQITTVTAASSTSNVNQSASATHQSIAIPLASGTVIPKSPRTRNLRPVQNRRPVKIAPAPPTSIQQQKCLRNNK